MDPVGSSPALTVVVAAITAFTGLAGAFIGGYLQSRTASNTAKKQAAAAAVGRFADWQMHKRQIYASLLQAVQAKADSPGMDAEAALRVSLASAMMVAHKELRQFLLSFEPNRQLDAANREALIAALVADTQQTGRNT